MIKSKCLFMAFVLLLCMLLLTCTACKQADNGDAVATTAKITRTTAPLPSIGWVTADSMRVRGGAGLSFDVVGGINFGDQVEILGKTGDWYEIRFGDGVGYISGQYLTFTTPTTAPSTTAATETTTETTAP